MSTGPAARPVAEAATAQPAAPAAAPPSAAPTAGYPARWRMLPIILVATFMGLFDFSAVNIAAPSLQQDLHASQTGLELVVAGYAFTYASGMVTGGRLGDLFGLDERVGAVQEEHV